MMKEEKDIVMLDNFYCMNSLKVGDKIDKDGEIEMISYSYIGISSQIHYLGREEAIKLIKHLRSVFDLDICTCKEECEKKNVKNKD